MNVNAFLLALSAVFPLYYSALTGAFAAAGLDAGTALFGVMAASLWAAWLFLALWLGLERRLRVTAEAGDEPEELAAGPTPDEAWEMLLDEHAQCCLRRDGERS